MPCSCKEQTGPFHSSPDYIYPGASPHSLTNNLSYSNRPKGSFLPFPPPTYLVSFIPFLTNLVSCWITPFFNPNYLIFSLFLFSVCLHICISNSIGRGWWYNISDNQIFCCNGKKSSTAEYGPLISLKYHLHTQKSNFLVMLLLIYESWKRLALHKWASSNKSINDWIYILIHSYHLNQHFPMFTS